MLKPDFSLPGHGFVLHNLVPVDFPSGVQSFPPCSGGGLLQILLFEWVPEPQGFEPVP